MTQWVVIGRDVFMSITGVAGPHDSEAAAWVWAKENVSESISYRRALDTTNRNMEGPRPMTLKDLAMIFVSWIIIGQAWQAILTSTLELIGVVQ